MRGSLQQQRRRLFTLVTRRCSTSTSTAKSTARCDVAIVGGGVMGLHTALQLLRRLEPESHVHLFEKSPGLGYGSSGSSSGILRAWYTFDEMVKFARDGIADYKRWSDYLCCEPSEVSARFTHCGLLAFEALNEKNAQLRADHYRSLKVDFSALSQRDINERWPMLNMDVVTKLHDELEPEDEFARRVRDFIDDTQPPHSATADLLHQHGQRQSRPIEMMSDERMLFEENAGYFEPGQSLMDVRYALEKHFKGRFHLHLNTEATVIKHRSGRVTGLSVKKLSGISGQFMESWDVHTPIIVNCNGPWFRKFILENEQSRLDGLDLSLTIDPVIVEVLFKESPELFEEPHCLNHDLMDDPGFQRVNGDKVLSFKHFPIVGDTLTGVYFRPQVKSKQVLVGSMEEHECDPRVQSSDLDDVSPDNGASPENRTLYLSGLYHRIQDGFMKKNSIGVRSLQAMYTLCREDNHPIIGRTSMEGLYLANGFSGHGFKCATQVGRGLAREITGVRLDGDSEADWSFFSPYRVPHKLDHKNVFA